jgi:D-alanyl-D-alanine dipeptidase
MERLKVISESYIRRMKAEECYEPLVDPTYYCDEILVRPDKDIRRLGTYIERRCFVRKGIAEKLAEVQRRLPSGYQLEINAGYRSKRLCDRYWREQYNKFKKNPHLTHRQLVIRTNRLVSPGKEDDEPTHSSGCAVDVYLRKDGKRVDMGVSKKEIDEISEKCAINYKNLTPEQKKNRMLLVNAMKEVGFELYPLEFWHYDGGEEGKGGNRYWAAYKKGRIAIYDTIPDEEYARKHDLVELRKHS